VPQADYWELDAEVRPETAELWGLFCFERGALGAEVLTDEGLLHTVRHSFATEPPARDWGAAFARDYPDVPPPTRLTLRRQAVQPWETAWRAHFTPLRLGRRLLVTPPWVAPESVAGLEALGDAPAGAPPAAPPAVRIVIEPGQGFGTGWHATTALALEELEAALDAAREARPPGPPPARLLDGLLDVGTGSGILAIAGRLLGVGAAVALDVDALALPEVRRNAALSGVAPLPAVVQGGPECLRGRFPLVVANIVSEVLRAHRDALAALTAPGGCLILSGILADERANLLADYAAAGLSLEAERSREPWVALRLRRP
jgi:ribosomal protein L11 methyltransferase